MKCRECLYKINDIEFERWGNFQDKHKKAKERYYECYPTGIGTAIYAVAKYRFKKVKENITDYDCW